MLIAIIGTRFSGKSTVEDYFIERDFTQVRINDSYELDGNTNHEIIDLGLGSLPPRDVTTVSSSIEVNNGSKTVPPSFLSSTNPLSPNSNRTLRFASAPTFLQYVTKNWKTNFVTVDLYTKEMIELFVKRPFFVLLSIDAPLYERFTRSQRSPHPVSLEEFVRDDDQVVFGNKSQDGKGRVNSLQTLASLTNVQVINSFRSTADLYIHLDKLNLPDPENLRPTWDAYFMTLASLASQRSNCMKRRVGAVLVRENRVLATGYNGTPRGLSNCNEGGCPHCNGTSFSSGVPCECVCLHAEENALLEAGRERVGINGVLYCNTCPCLRCTVKIIQTGVKTVVYNLSYKVDDASAALFKQAGVELRRYNPNKTVYLPVS